jgi:hypothetical protein
VIVLIVLSVVFYISFDAGFKSILIGIPPPNARDDSTKIAPPTILLVSAFFPLPKSQHSISDYEEWLSRFLQPIATPIYFFTTPDMEQFIRSLHGSLPIIINTTFSSPFNIPPLKDGLGTKEMYEEMWEWDQEKDIRNAELYAVWTVKPYFLDKGL